MKKVVLLGDSIRLLGYGNKVPELLGNDYQVIQSTDNGRFVKYTLRMVFEQKNTDLKGADVIHWNNGLWDVDTIFDGDGTNFTSKEEYLENILRVAKILKGICKNVIFATTTPVRTTHFTIKNEDIDAYNALVVPKLKKMGILINDLNSLVKKDIDRYIGEDKIHLSQEGIDLCANQVAEIIKSCK